ncbi:MAG: hypothetical protein Q8N18_01540 [Opitutaceae bacterium]|nr:hypothetical protein [Opitutaceae bacterium]
MLALLSLPDLRRRAALFGWMLVAALPVAYIAVVVIAASRNIVFWDEFDTALDLIIRMNAGAGSDEILGRLVALNNEHRMVTSRLLFAASYWLTGTVNFAFVGAIGNLFMVATCVILVLAVRGTERRVRLGVVLAFLMFQLEHFENFIWSGASIDHFQVVTLAVGAIVALARGSGGGVALAGALALTATFTLAHGSLVWPVGAALLAHQRRWRQLGAWIAAGTVALLLFLWGFKFNPGHNISALTWESVGAMLRYWLALLGAPLTLGHAGFAPLPGVLLLGSLGVLAARGALAREPIAMFVALYVLGALALVAFGRAEIAGAEINSRYMVLGALAWALLLFMLLERLTPPDRPYLALAGALPALAALALTANVKFSPQVEGFVEVRDRAATRFTQYGEDGRGIAPLHPRPGHAEVLLRIAAERGLYTLPVLSRRAEFPEPATNLSLERHIDELIVNDHAVTVGGWAMRLGHVSRRGQVHLVLRSPQSTLFFSTITLQRPDVATAHQQPDWRLAGFRAVITRERLPAEDFEVGVLIKDGDRVEYAMTPNRLLLAAGSEARAERGAGQ